LATKAPEFQGLPSIFSLKTQQLFTLIFNFFTIRLHPRYADYAQFTLSKKVDNPQTHCYKTAYKAMKTILLALALVCFAPSADR